MAPRDGFEPPTNGLTVRRSTTELPGNAEDASIGVDRGGVQLASVLVRLDARRLSVPFTGQAPPGKRAPGKNADSGVGAERHHFAFFLAVEQIVVVLHGDEARPSVLAREVQ